MRSERERKLEKISFEYDSFGMAENIDDLRVMLFFLQ